VYFHRLLVPLLIALTTVLLVSPAALASNGGGVSAPQTGSNPVLALGGGGSEYYEVEGTDHQFDWARVKSRISARRWEDGRSHGIKNDPYLGWDAVEALCGSLLGNVSANRWRDECPLWWSRDPRSYPNWEYEIHDNRDPEWSNKPVGINDDRTLAWNIKIWREGQNTPIFQRRINLRGCQDHVSWPNWMREWWYGCFTDKASGETVNGNQIGGLFSNGYRTAGPIGMFNQASYNACQANYNAGTNRRWLESNKDGKTAQPARNPNNEFRGRYKALRGDFGWCYWEGNRFTDNPRPTDDQRRRREALFVNWKLSQNGKDSWLTYNLAGEKCRYYAVQIVGVRRKERLEEGLRNLGRPNTDYIFWSDTNRTRTSQNENFLRVYVPNYSDCGPPEREPEPNVSDTEPGAEVSLTMPRSKRTNEKVDINATIGTVGYLDDTQAVFPRTIRLQHFTPQQRFNGSGRGTSPAYGHEYAVNNSDLGAGNRTLVALRASTQALTFGGGTQYFARYPQPVQLLRGLDSFVLSSNDWMATYLRPTLHNPCTNQNNTYSNMRSSQEGTWPTAAPQNCPRTAAPEYIPTYRNAWDDFYSAFGTWEERWARVSDRYAANQDSVFRNELLRCDDQGRRLDADGNANCTRQWPFLSDYAVNSSTQYAQGYAYVYGPRNPPGNIRSRNGRLHVVLQQRSKNGQDKVATAAVTDRDTGEIVGRHPQDTSDPKFVGAHSNSRQNPHNSLTGRREQHFCRQGLPYNPSNPNSYRAEEGGSYRYRAVRAAEAGDPDCEGWSMHWDWEWTEDSCVTEEVESLPRLRSRFARLPASTPAVAQPWGGYMGTDADMGGNLAPTTERNFAFGNISNRPIVRSLDSRAGEPGRQGGETRNYSLSNVKRCWKWELEDGRYQVGDWHLSGFAFQARTNGDNATLCNFGPPAQSNGLKPVWTQDPVAAPDGNGSQCIGRPTGRGRSRRYPAWHNKYTFGYWYRTGWYWNWRAYPNTGKPTTNVQIRSDTIACGPNGNQLCWPHGDNPFCQPGLGNAGQTNIADSPRYSRPPQPNSASTNWGTNPSNTFYRGDITIPWQDSGYRNGWRCKRWVLKPGWLTRGSWQINDADKPGVGWGRNNTGDRLPKGPYQINYVFSGLTPDDLVDWNGTSGCDTTGSGLPYTPGYCWRLTAKLDTSRNWEWFHDRKENNANAQQDGVTYTDRDSALLGIFGPRQNR
jgi:hypothetical protein